MIKICERKIIDDHKRTQVNEVPNFRRLKVCNVLAERLFDIKKQ